MAYTHSTALFSEHGPQAGGLAKGWVTLRGDLWRFALKRLRVRKLLQARARARFKARFGFQFPQNPQLFPADYLDLENLIDRVLELKPARILEMGGGMSTYALAFATAKLRESGHQIEFHTLDQSEQYLEVTRANLPPELREVPVYHHSPIHVAMRDGIKASFFDRLPEGVFNYVYEDRCDHADTAVAGDLLPLEERAIAAGAPFSFTIDLMVATADVCKRRMKRTYEVRQEFTTGTNFIQA